MTRCQCIRKDGKQCVRDASIKQNQNSLYCWQHQVGGVSSAGYSRQKLRLKGGYGGQPSMFNDGLLDLPAIGFGTFIGLEHKKLPEKERFLMTKEAVLDALTTGYQMLDLAESYRNHAAIGQALKESGIPRSKIFLIGKGDSGLSSVIKTIMEIFECSAEDVGQGDYYLDLFLWHHPLQLYENNLSIWDQIDQCKKLGYAKNIGVSNVYQNGLSKLIDYCSKKGLDLPVANEIEVNLRNQEADYIKFCQEVGVRVIAYSPLGYANVSMNLTDEKVLKIAEEHSVSPAQVILAYLISKGIAVIPSSRDLFKIKENLQSTELVSQLKSSEMMLLESLNWKFMSTMTAQEFKVLDEAFNK